MLSILLTNRCTLTLERRQHFLWTSSMAGEWSSYDALGSLGSRCTCRLGRSNKASHHKWPSTKILFYFLKKYKQVRVYLPDKMLGCFGQNSHRCRKGSGEVVDIKTPVSQKTITPHTCRPHQLLSHTNNSTI